jgi:hypothetical protein
MEKKAYCHWLIGFLFFFGVVAAPEVSATIRIMPLGDSITVGNASGVVPDTAAYWVSYRKYLWESLTAAGYDVDFVGYQSHGYAFYPPFDSNHAGYGGIRDDQIAHLLDTGYNQNTGHQDTPGPYLETYPANVILLHIGTNGLDPSPDDVEKILDEIDEYSEHVTVVLARIINRRDGSPMTTQFNDNVEAMALARMDPSSPDYTGDKIVIVDMENGAGIVYGQAPSDGDIWDDVHPYETGYAKMATVWMEALEGILPKADAGPNQDVVEGDTATLDGSGSTDPKAGGLSYQWEQTGGPIVVLSDPTEEQPTFTTPDVDQDGASLTFQLTVTDNDGLQDADTCVVNVTWLNEAPMADAGDDQTVDEGASVLLDGSNSLDPDDGIASYLWEKIEGPEVSLTDADKAQASFTAPDVGPDGVSLTFKLTVTDYHGSQSTDSCIVNVTWLNAPPTADAGPDQEVYEGYAVTLDGSGSDDPDDWIASYLWTQASGIPVTLSDPTALKPTFVTPIVDQGAIILTFELTVQDSRGLKATDQVSVTVYDNGIAGFPTDVLTMTCSTGEHIGIRVESGGHLVDLCAVDPSTIPISSYEPEDLIYGLIYMLIKTDTLGGEARVTFYLPTSAEDDYKWFKYSSSKGWQDCSPCASFDSTRNQITLALTDGCLGDDDRIANRFIVDPSGLGTGSSAPAITCGGADWATEPGCFITTAAYGSRMGKEVKVLEDFRDSVLMRNAFGKSLLSLYYRISPHLGKYIKDHETLRKVTRVALIPVVYGIKHPKRSLVFLLCTSILISLVPFGFARFRGNSRKE